MRSDPSQCGAGEIKQLKRSNMALQSKLLEFEVSWSQHTDALRQIQQAHELELKQVGGLSPSMLHCILLCLCNTAENANIAP